MTNTADIMQVEMDKTFIQAVRQAAREVGLKFGSITVISKTNGKKEHRIIVEEERYSFIIHTDALFGGGDVVLTSVYDYLSDREYVTDNRMGKFVGIATSFCLRLMAINERADVIKELLEKYGKGDVELSPEYSFEERKYMGEEFSVYIEHYVEGYPETSLLFEERTFILDIREDIFQGLASEDDLIQATGNNELNYIYDYDNPVAIRLEGGELQWL